MLNIFGDDGKQLGAPLDRGHALYKTPDTERVQYRDWGRRTVGNISAPLLRGMTIGGRLAVVYSPEDLSVGLVGEAVDGIGGYQPASATALMRQVLLSVK